MPDQGADVRSTVPTLHFMNFVFTPSLALLASLSLVFTGWTRPVRAQGMVYAPGDLILGFQATGGDGSSNTYVYNLGAGTGFRDGTTTGLIANIGADLATTFGVGWFGRNDVYWGIAGVRDPSAGGPVGVVNGDPKATIYVSRVAGAGAGSSTPWVLASGPTVISAATSVASMQFGFTTINGSDVITPETQRVPTPGSGGRGTIQGTGDINNWSVFNPVGGPAFGNVLTGGVQASLGDGGAVHWLDLYRIMGRASASATPNTPLGQGLLVGSFSINAVGEVSFQTTSAPSNPYDIWAAASGLGGADAQFAGDPDGDGLENGVEFVIGGNPKQATDADKAPALTREADAVVFVFRRVDAAAELNPGAQFTTNQFGAWTPAVDGTAGVTVTSENDAFGAGVDRVTVRLPWTPAAGASIFVRLAVNPKP